MTVLLGSVNLCPSFAVEGLRQNLTAATADLAIGYSKHYVPPRSSFADCELLAS